MKRALEVAAPRVRIRVAVRADIEAMHAVRVAVRENQLVSAVITAADYEREIEVTGRGWVAELDSEVVGFAIGNLRDGNIWALFVHPDHERRGVGRRLHDTLVASLFESGQSRLWLTTDPRTRAFKFYVAAGWVPVEMTQQGAQCFELTLADWRH